MKSLLLRAAPLALCLALSQPALAQSATAPAATEQPAQLGSQQWREDLAFMVAEMRRRHPNLHHSISRERFEAAVADLHARVPQLQRNEIIVGLMRIAAMVGDGHTRIEPRKDPEFAFRSLPLKLYLFEDGLFVRAARPEHAALVGAKIIEVGGVPVAEAIRRVNEISSRENAMGLKFYASLFLNMPDILHALQLSPSRDAAVFKLQKDGRIWTATVPAGQVDPVWPPDTDISLVTPDEWVDARTTPKPPLWLERPLDYHRLIDLPEHRAIYAQLNMVADVEGQTLGQFGKAIADRARAANPRLIILDLRLNHGGDGSRRNPFVRELIRAEDEDTRLVVLTWRGTYSASQFILNDLDRLSQAHFIGEPAGSRPSSYGDAYRATLPNSGITLRTSTKWWQAEQDFAPWTYMDVSVPLRFADYAAGRDPVLDAAIGFDAPARLHDLVAAGDGVEGVRSALDGFVADPRNRYVDLERQLLISVEQLAGAGRFDEALLVVEFAAKRFPGSHDVHYFHAYVAQHAGKLDLAVAAIRRALAADPNSREARSFLERLESETKRES